MNRMVVFSLGGAGVMLFTAITLVVVPFMQFSVVKPEEGLSPYTSEQDEGRKTYVSLGCVYCHSQQPRDPSFGPDDKRGWGRPSSPGDYAYDYPHQLGTMRTGPDLFNIGKRQPSQDWHLAHLYAPRALVAGSIMPSYRFMFAEKARPEDSDVVVHLPPGFGPAQGVVVATPEALSLVAYLQSLDHTYPSRYMSASTEQGGLR
jgi:cytochrome c oxidase cbb3-type subunit 2